MPTDPPPSFRYEPRRDASTPLEAIAGYNDEPLPLDIHIHSELEIGIVIAGEERILLGETTLVCGPGDVWLCGMWEPHGWEIRPRHTRNVVLKFLPEFLGAETVGDIPWLLFFLSPPSERPRVTSWEMRRRVLAVGRVLRQEVDQQRPAWQEVVRAELVCLLIELRRGWEASAVPAAENTRSSSLARMMPAINLAHSRPPRRVSVREGAAACGLSASQFQQLFRRAMGTSFGAFCLRARLVYAARRMLDTDRSISAIAEEAGFVDDSHLHRLIVRQFACTPAQYRARGQARSRG